jgi:hypothetical protein
MKAAAYPKRPKFFAHKFCRLLFKQCVANEIGAEACWLLTVIAHAEDARHYTGAVTFFNSQLLSVVGLGSADALERVRRKAIEGGWLHYEPGAKRTPGRYWVTIPDQCAGVEDGPTDEGVDDDVIVVDSTAKSREQPRSKCGSNRGECAEPSSLTLSLTQKTPLPPAKPGGVVGDEFTDQKTRTRADTAPGEDDPRFERFWAAYPRRENKSKAAQAFARIDPAPELLERMLAAIERQRRRGCLEPRTHQDRDMRPHPANWLDRRRWEDEAPAVEPTTDRGKKDAEIVAARTREAQEKAAAQAAQASLRHGVLSNLFAVPK